MVISNDGISCYSRMNISRKATMRTMKALLPLHNPSIITKLHSTLRSEMHMEALICTNKINQAFPIEQFREDSDINTYFASKDWNGVLESMHPARKSVKKRGKILKEISVILMDINTPMLS